MTGVPAILVYPRTSGSANAASVTSGEDVGHDLLATQRQQTLKQAESLMGLLGRHEGILHRRG